MVIVDDSAWQSLQIFSTDIHPSSFKQGNSSSNKEGLSIFSLLDSCMTTQGSKMLRLMLLRPSRNPEILNRRYDVIEYCTKTNHLEFVKSMLDTLKLVKSIPVRLQPINRFLIIHIAPRSIHKGSFLQKLVYRLSILRATVTEWRDLYQSLYQMLLICEICRSLESAPQFLKDV